METNNIHEDSIFHIDSQNVYFMWTIRNFSLYNGNIGDRVVSEIFPNLNETKYQWCIWFYPFGEDDDSKDFISIYLEFLSQDRDNLFVKFQFGFKSVDNKCLGVVDYIYPKPAQQFDVRSVWGHHKLLQRDHIIPFLKDDVLIITCLVKWYAGNASAYNEINILDKQDIQNELSRNLHDFMNVGSFSDVVLVANDGTEFPAHRFMLAARSSVFAQMFHYDNEEKRDSRVEVADLDSVTMKSLLEFIYSGKFVENNPNIDKLLYAANKYSLDYLKELCARALQKQLNVENAAYCLLLADQCNVTYLKEETIEFIFENWNSVIETDALKNLLFTQPDLFYDILKVMKK